MSQKIILNAGDAPIQITNGSQSAFVTIAEGDQFQVKHSASQPKVDDPSHTIRAKDINRINTLTIAPPFQMWVWVNSPNVRTTLIVSAA